MWLFKKLLSYSNLYKSTFLFNNFFLKKFFKILLFLICIILPFIITTVSLLCFSFFFEYFWCQGVFEYILYLLFIGGIRGYLSIFIIIIIFLKLFYLFWVAVTNVLILSLVSLFIGFFVFLSARKEYLILLDKKKKSIILEKQFIDTTINGFNFKTINEKEILKKKYQNIHKRHDPYNISFKEVLKPGLFNFIDLNYIEGNYFYYKYNRPELDITFEQAYYKILKFSTNNILGDSFTWFLFLFVRLALPESLVFKLRNWKLIQLYIYLNNDSWITVIYFIYFLVFLNIFAYIFLIIRDTCLFHD